MELFEEPCANSNSNSSSNLNSNRIQIQIQVGLMGDAARGGVAMANEPNLVPALYDPRAPAGKRYTELAQTLIPRLLHSTAGLTTNGTVLVSASNA